MSSPQGKIVFVIGGVMSGIGKGIVVASLASILKDCGLRVNTLKLDPYLNVDAGTMNPFEHGETYITCDGLETDLDLGHYERFTGNKLTKHNITTSGKIYQTIIEKERRGDFLGSTVQMIPHVCNEIIAFIMRDVAKHDITLCEIGGTVGDIESMVHMEAIRQIRGNASPCDVGILFLTYIPFLNVSNEYKTKPAQDSLKSLLHSGLMPDMIMCRFEPAAVSGDDVAFVKKIALYSNVRPSHIFLAPNVDNIYKLPFIYSQQGIHTCLLQLLDVSVDGVSFLPNVSNIYRILGRLEETIHINAVVKYGYADAYISLGESLKHAAYSLGKNVKVNWIDVRSITVSQTIDRLASSDYATLILGGFGAAGVENKIVAIRHCRLRNIPCLGICYGMQLMAVEYARNVLGLVDATTEEIDDGRVSSHHIVHIIDKSANKLGGTMRLGDYEGVVREGTLAHRIYGGRVFEERHRHRYEINAQYAPLLEKRGFVFSGYSPDGKYKEISEAVECDFHVGVQFHPEFNTCVYSPNKMILAFVEKAYSYQQSRLNAHR